MIGLLLVCEQTVWQITSAQCHWDLRGLGGKSASAWCRVIGERETRWRKRGVSLGSGTICGITSVPKSAPQELPTRVTHKSVPERECPTKVS